jgi:hypothetical protein
LFDVGIVGKIMITHPSKTGPKSAVHLSQHLAFYFAYGSNMSPPRLGFRLPAIQVVGGASLPDHRLAFHKAGTDGSGKCDIPDCRQSVVFGVVYAIRKDDFSILDCIEGVGAGYERETVDVHMADQRLTVQTYRATRIDPDLRPFSWYRHHVLAGALSAGLSESYVERIRAVDVVRDHDLQRERRELAIYQGSGTQ